MGIQMLKIHWKAAKWPILPVLITAFGLPLMSGRAFWGAEYTEEALLSQSAWGLVSGSASFSIFYPLLAFVAGTILALTAWNWDHGAGHVYPLSLPIARWKYSAMKFGTGVILVGATSGVFLAGAAISSALVALPAGLHSYPAHLAGQFFVATLTAYALLFALAAGTIRTTVLVLSFSIGTILFGNGIVDLATSTTDWNRSFDIPTEVVSFLIEDGGPLSVFGGNWLLIDV